MIIRPKDKDDDKKKKNSVIWPKPTNNEGTAAWQDSATDYQPGHVGKPPIERVIDAKDWVDNGSKL
ncbi:hypothetical protein HNQ56_003035 [Anaerotaenia torta]|uniref:CDIF630_02480 family spore surface protein n=1 Tax=Anaerotaenia torta TaxID=433293 RepID=UPI003D23876F